MPMPLYLCSYTLPPAGTSCARMRLPNVQRSAEVSRKSKMPFGDELSNVRRCALLKTISAISLSSGVVTAGVWYQHAATSRSSGKCAG